MESVLNALVFLNQNNIVHRDLKPANILINDHIFKLADFGFAKFANYEELEQFHVGTPLYMAPEAMNHYKYSHKTDVWAFCCMFYELLVGTEVFE